MSVTDEYLKNIHTPSVALLVRALKGPLPAKRRYYRSLGLAASYIQTVSTACPSPAGINLAQLSGCRAATKRSSPSPPAVPLAAGESFGALVVPKPGKVVYVAA